MSPERLKINGKPSSDVRTELLRLNDRITTVVNVFNELVTSLRDDIKRLDSRLHQLLEEGAIARMNEKIIKLEEHVDVFSKCSDEIHLIKLEVIKVDSEVTKIDQRTKLLLWVGAAIFGPTMAWAVIYAVQHLLLGQ